MRVLIVHNRYQQAGGEDGVVATEQALLERHGHEVTLVEASNAVIQGPLEKARAGLGALYSLGGRRRVRLSLDAFRPDVVHVHNFFPLLSPSVFDACRAAEVPVVQTLHNYRLACPNALLFRDGAPCEACVDRAVPWPGVVHGCYRGSRVQSAVVAGVTTLHRYRGTWRERVDAFVVLSRFQQAVLQRAGLPADRMHVKPNCVADPGQVGEEQGAYALYVGRLSPEKGLRTLVEAYALGDLAVPLKIVGDGPLRGELQARVAGADAGARVEFLGWRPKEEVHRLIQSARFLVCPSEWYEACPLVVPEAFARGCPVVASACGSLQEAVEDGVSGWLVAPGDPAQWREVLRQVWQQPDEAKRRGRNARQRFEAIYSERAGYERLMEIYARLVPSPGVKSPPP